MADALGHDDQRLLRSGALLAEAACLDDVVAALRLTAREIACSDGIAVVLRDGGRCHYVDEDAIEVLWKGQRFPLEACVSGWSMLHDETVVVPDVSLDPRVPVAPYQTKAIRSLVMTPIGSPKPVAALGAYWSAMILPDDVTLARIHALADQAAQALMRIQAKATRPMDAA
jgi:L-methionine (R)-S-oxide reductase